MTKIKKETNNNIVTFPSKMNDGEREVEAIIFAAAEPLDIDTIESKISKKIDKKAYKEEKELSKWLNQPEAELKIVFGEPDKIEFSNGKNRYYIYITEKLKIKCERKFEIDPKNVVVGFSSKNCF